MDFTVPGRLRADLMRVAAIAVLALAGCGGSDEEPSATAATPAPEATARPVAEPEPKPAEPEPAEPDPAETEPAEAPTGRATKASLRACLPETGARLLDEGEAPPGGDPRLGLDVEEARYAGFVVWPSGTLADLYLTADGAAAESAATLYERFLERLGAGARAAELVEPRGNLVVAFDDERTPSAAEVAELDCAF